MINSIKSIYLKCSIQLFGLVDTPASGNQYEASDFRSSDILTIEDTGKDIHFTFPACLGWGDIQTVVVPRDNVKQIVLVPAKSNVSVLPEKKPKKAGTDASRSLHSTPGKI